MTECFTPAPNRKHSSFNESRCQQQVTQQLLFHLLCVFSVTWGLFFTLFASIVFCFKHWDFVLGSEHCKKTLETYVLYYTWTHPVKIRWSIAAAAALQASCSSYASKKTQWRWLSSWMSDHDQLESWEKFHCDCFLWTQKSGESQTAWEVFKSDLF